MSIVRVHTGNCRTNQFAGAECSDRSGKSRGGGQGVCPERINKAIQQEGYMQRVLITDDAAFMRKMLGDILKKNGYQVAGEASNGQEAVEKYRALLPDFVTMDITMPVMDGIEAVRAIRQFDEECKVLVVSAMGQRGMILEAIQAGASGFIVKPFQESKVVEEVERLWK